MKRIFFFIVALALPALVHGHDFWIEPSTFHPAVGDTVSFGLRVGQDFLGDPVARSQSLIDTFVARDSKAQHPVGGFENQDPAGYIKVARGGVTTVAYRSKANPLELPAGKFNQFLKDEGLDDIARLRAERGETDKPDRERFFRYAKTLLLTGATSSPESHRAVGFRYEIVPQSDPWSESPLRVRVLFDGKPLSGALVTAIHRDDPQARASARSDAQGRVTLNLPRRGVWLIKSVHMTAAPAGTNADWESSWASLTFER